MAAHVADWTEEFPPLAGLDAHVRVRLRESGKVLSLPDAAPVFAAGEIPQNLLIVLSGCVCVRQITEDGHEIVLYRVHAGESCVLTTACLFADESYSAEAVTEGATQAIAIPRGEVDRLMAEAPVFRRFVFHAYGQRIADLFGVIEDLAFRRIGPRLARSLLARAAGDRVIATHAQLAAELGTAREVVSRQLKDFASKGYVGVERGVVVLFATDRLRALAGSANNEGPR